MADMLPKIVEAAKKSGHVKVRCPRVGRMAKELRRHLPTGFDIIFDEERGQVEIKRRIVLAGGSCSTGPTCVGRP